MHELFSNVFPQSAETREFPNSLKLAPDGSFIIAKGVDLVFGLRVDEEDEEVGLDLSQHAETAYTS